MTTTQIMGLVMLALPFVVLFVLVARLEGVKVAVSTFVFIAALLAWLVVGVELVKGAA